MEIIDVMGKPCPIPVIETKKALIKPGVDAVLVKVDNIVAVQNLEKMAKGSGYTFTYEEKPDSIFEVRISSGGTSGDAVRDANNAEAVDASIANSKKCTGRNWDCRSDK